MNDIGAFWERCITSSSEILATVAVVAVGAVYGIRYLGAAESTKYRLEMRARTAANVFFFFLALVSGYQASRIANIHKVLTEMNAPYYEGGQGASPVAEESELKAIQRIAGRALRAGVAALLLSGIGWVLQYRKMKQYRAAVSANGSA